MESLKIQIDNREIEAFAGMTILQAAELAGIRIPTLCHHRDFIPSGSCRICVVELEGTNRLIGSCHTPVAKGMVLRTRSPKVLSARKATVELLLAGHTGPCVMDFRAGQCDLHKIASDLEVAPPRFHITRPRFYPIENVSPYVHRIYPDASCARGALAPAATSRDSTCSTRAIGLFIPRSSSITTSLWIRMSARIAMSAWSIVLLLRSAKPSNLRIKRGGRRWNPARLSHRFGKQTAAICFP